MVLSLAVLSLAVAVFLFIAAAIANRRQKKSFLTNDMMVSCIVLPLIITLAALGTAGIIQSLIPGKHPSLADMTVAAVILAVAITLFAVLGLGRKRGRPAHPDRTTGRKRGDSSKSRHDSDKGPVGGSPPMQTPA